MSRETDNALRPKPPTLDYAAPPQVRRPSWYAVVFAVLMSAYLVCVGVLLAYAMAHLFVTRVTGREMVSHWMLLLFAPIAVGFVLLGALNLLDVIRALRGLPPLHTRWHRIWRWR